MSYEDSAPGGDTDANAVRRSVHPEAQIHPFPADRVIRPAPGSRGDQVQVTHRGRSILFDSPEAMHANARECDPLARAQLQEIADLRSQALELRRVARIHLAEARAARAKAEGFLTLLGRAAILALILAGVCWLGAL